MPSSEPQYPSLPEHLIQSPASEGLQTAPPDGLQAAQPDKIPWSGEQEAPHHWQPADSDQQHPLQKQPRQRRICGLPLWAFWTLVGVAALVVVAGAVGGGVGGTRGQKNGSGNPASTSHSDATAGRTSSSLGVSSPSTATGMATMTTNNVSIVTTEVPGPTTTLLRDCPSVNETIYSVAGYADEPMLFRQYCGSSFLNGLVVNGIDQNVVNTPTQSLSDCIDLCASHGIIPAGVSLTDYLEHLLTSSPISV